MSNPVVTLHNPTLAPAGGATDGPKGGDAKPPGGATAGAGTSAASSKSPAGSGGAASAGTPPAKTSSTGASASKSEAGTVAADAQPGAEGKPAGDAKTAEGEKPPEVRKAAVILAEREAKLVEDRRAFKTESERLATERKAHEADLATARAILDAAKGKGKLTLIDAAAKHAGLTREQMLEAIQDEYLAGVREPTQDEKIGRTVEERLAAERKKAEDERKAVADAELKKQQDAGQAAYNGYAGQVEALAAELGPKFAEEFDLCATFNVSKERVTDKALEMWKASGGPNGGKTPTPREALAAVEAELAETVGKSKKFRAAPAAPEEKQAPAARDSTPRTLTSKDRSVPIVPKPKADGRKPTALERLAEARRELGDA